VSLGAVIAVWPISSYTFGIISLVGPLTTFLISPALTPIIIFGSLSALVGLVNPPIAQFIGWIAWLFLSYMIVIVVSFAVLPAAFIKNKPFDSIFIWIYYFLFLLLINLKTGLNIINNLFSKFRSRFSDWGYSAEKTIGSRVKYIIPPLLIITILTSIGCTSLPENNLKVSFLNVGEGDSILIQSNGQNILIDGGPSGQAVCQELGNMLPFWERKIDLLILSHPHLDHLTGLLEVMKRYQIGKVLASPLSSDLPAYQEFLQISKKQKIEYLTAISGQIIMLSNGAILEILNPSDNIDTDSAVDMDEYSLVISLSYGSHSLLLTSDIGSKTESLLLRERLVQSVDILKIAHHGSGNSSSAPFLKAVGFFYRSHIGRCKQPIWSS
jgi:competence protein ComEC